MNRAKGKGLCALWFGGFAAALAAPLGVARFYAFNRCVPILSNELPISCEPHLALRFVAVAVETGIPVVMAAVFGMLIGPGIWLQDNRPTAGESFWNGVKIAARAGAVSWVAGMLLLAVLSRFLHPMYWRLAGNVWILMVFGFPVYGTWAGIAGLVLRWLRPDKTSC